MKYLLILICLVFFSCPAFGQNKITVEGDTVPVVLQFTVTKTPYYTVYGYEASGGIYYVFEDTEATRAVKSKGGKK